MEKIYDQHCAAFKNVSAFCLTLNGENIGNVAFKFPRDGAGRLYCYLHVYGLQMIRGHANGYGYDKKSAAFIHAAHKLDTSTSPVNAGWTRDDLIVLIREASKKMNSGHWDTELARAGFSVLQAV